MVWMGITLLVGNCQNSPQKKLLCSTFCIFWLCPTCKTLKSSCSRSCVLFCLDFFSLYYWCFLSGFSACLLVFCFIYSLWQTAVLFFSSAFIYFVFFCLSVCSSSPVSWRCIRDWSQESLTQIFQHATGEEVQNQEKLTFPLVFRRETEAV